MAGQVWDIFADNYFKQMKRPELLNEGPDSAYGANMVRGSENTNPWAGRDQSNAKFGRTAQPTPVVGSSPVPSPLGAKPSGGSPFAALLTPGMSPASKWMSTSGWDKLKGIFTPSETSNPQGYGELKELVKGGFSVPEGVSELGGYSKLAQEFNPMEVSPNIPLDIPSEGVSPTGIGPTSMGLAAAPKALEAITGSKLVGDIGSAGVNTGLAIAQGGLNPVSDAAALFSLFKLFRGLF